MKKNIELWMNRELMTAYFHREEVYSKVEIENLQPFVYFIKQLVEKGYRFQ